MNESLHQRAHPAPQHTRTAHESGADYRELFENALEGIYRSTPVGRFLAVNPALVRMLGYDSAAEVLALRLPDDLYVDPNERERARVRNEGKSEVRGDELRWKKKNGEIIIVSVSARIIRNAQGKVVCYEGLVQDITERKQAETALQAVHEELERRVEARTAELAQANMALRAEIVARQQVEAALRQSEERYRLLAHEREQRLIASDRLVSFGELAASLAHEFNNPLGIAMGFAQDLLSETPSDDPRSQRLQIIETETRRCGQLMRNLLDLASPPQTQLILTDLSSLIHHSLALMSGRTRRGKVATELRLSTELPQLLVDPQQLEQVLLNLFFNAIEAMPEGGILTVSGTYLPSSSHDGTGQPPEAVGEVVLAVADTGIGIAPRDMPKIFRTFFTTKKQKGMGLGLSICESIMKAHGGRITVESAPGQGTTFFLHLPRKGGADVLDA